MRILGRVERGVSALSALTISLLGRNKRSVCYAHNERIRVKGNGHVNKCQARQSSVYRGAMMSFLGYDVSVLSRHVEDNEELIRQTKPPSPPFVSENLSARFFACISGSV